MSRRTSRFRNRTERPSELARAERAARQPAAPVAPVDLANQYRYVIGDLQRVGIIAFVLVATMILLRIFVIK